MSRNFCGFGGGFGRFGGGFGRFFGRFGGGFKFGFRKKRALKILQNEKDFDKKSTNLLLVPQSELYFMLIKSGEVSDFFGREFFLNLSKSGLKNSSKTSELHDFFMAKIYERHALEGEFVVGFCQTLSGNFAVFAVKHEFFAPFSSLPFLDFVVPECASFSGEDGDYFVVGSGFVALYKNGNFESVKTLLESSEEAVRERVASFGEFDVVKVLRASELTPNIAFFTPNLTPLPRVVKRSVKLVFCLLFGILAGVFVPCFEFVESVFLSRENHLLSQNVSIYKWQNSNLNGSLLTKQKRKNGDDLEAVSSRETFEPLNKKEQIFNTLFDTPVVVQKLHWLGAVALASGVEFERVEMRQKSTKVRVKAQNKSAIVVFLEFFEHAKQGNIEPKESGFVSDVEIFFK